MHFPESQQQPTSHTCWRCARLVLFVMLLTAVTSAAVFLTAKRLNPAADTGGTGVPPPAADRKLP